MTTKQLTRAQKKIHAEAKEKGQVVVTFKMDMNYVKGEDREGILGLGYFESEGARLSPAAAVSLYRSFTGAVEGHRTQAEEMLFDLLDGTKRWEEIKEQTGLDDARCQEIYGWYVEQTL